MVVMQALNVLEVQKQSRVINIFDLTMM